MIFVTEGFFPVKERTFLVTGTLFPVVVWQSEISNVSLKANYDRHTDRQTLPKKEHLVSQYIFPVNERIFHITGNKLPVTGSISPAPRNILHVT